MKKIFAAIVLLFLFATGPSNSVQAGSLYSVKNMDVIVKYPKVISAPVTGCTKVRVYAKLRLRAEDAMASNVKLQFWNGGEVASQAFIKDYAYGKFKSNGKKSISATIKVCRKDWRSGGEVVAGVGNARSLQAVVEFYAFIGPETGTYTQYGRNMRLTR